MSRKKILVVGGGITGIALSKFLSLKKNEITILESSNKLGGFLKSTIANGSSFDLGPHYIRETGEKKIDKILFKKIKKDWININYLKSGNFFKKKIIEHNQFINIKELTDYTKSLAELQKNNYETKKFKNEYDRCLNIFGKIITKKVIEPIMFKYTGLKLNKLPIELSTKFGLGRVIINNKKLTFKLKKQKKFDDCIAFESHKEGVSFKKNYYPKNGCIDQFVKYFLKKKIKIVLNSTIKEFKIKKNFITEIVLSSGEIIKADKIFWTIPREQFLKIINKNKIYNRKKKIFWKFINIISDKKLKSNCYYINIHDPKTNIYRITLYRNLQKNDKKNRMTIEHVSPKYKNINHSYIKRYLVKIGLISGNQKIDILNQVTIPMNLPLKQIETSKDDYIKNLKFIGGGFFNQISQEHTITNVYNLARQQ
jgi:protoporphyrinogen oxidase